MFWVATSNPFNYYPYLFADNKTNFTTAKVYVITNAFQLPVSFNNGIREVSNKTEDVSSLLHHG